MGSMDSLISRGESDVQKKLKEGTESIEAIGEEFEGVKDQLKDMPGGLDDDLLQMIREAEEAGRGEALRDIEDANRRIIDTAKQEADSLKSDVQSKISDNASARGQLDSISSKYGRDSISQAKSAIDANTDKGEELLRMLEEAIKDADKNIGDVKTKL